MKVSSPGITHTHQRVYKSLESASNGPRPRHGRPTEYNSNRWHRRRRGLMMGIRMHIPCTRMLLIYYTIAVKHDLAR